MFNIAEEDNDYNMLVNNGIHSGPLFIFHYLLKFLKFKEFQQTINNTTKATNQKKPKLFIIHMNETDLY